MKTAKFVHSGKVFSSQKCDDVNVFLSFIFSSTVNDGELN